MRIKLREGDIFSVPIEDYYIIGIITRISSLKVPFGFFYKSKFKEPPIVEEIDFDNKESEIMFKGKFGIQGFKKQTWKIIGSIKKFDKENWPLPVFYNKRFSLPGELIYLDDNLDVYKREKAPLSEESYEDFPDIDLAGSGYIEKRLSKLLANF
jgi:hypothetical protein